MGCATTFLASHFVLKSKSTKRYYCSSDLFFYTLFFLSILSNNFSILKILISGCHQTFVSRPGGPMNGTFTGPEFTNYRGLTLSCVYTFLGGPGQRVQITFDTFRLRGAPPEWVLVLNGQLCLKNCLWFKLHSSS